MKLNIIEGDYSVIRLPPDHADFDLFQGEGFLSITRTKDGLSVICDLAKTDIGSLDASHVEYGWACLQVDGVLDFSMVGVLSSIAEPLARAEISIFAISTYNTDYILVKKSKLEAAKAVLIAAGFEIKDMKA